MCGRSSPQRAVPWVRCWYRAPAPRDWAAGAVAVTPAVGAQGMRWPSGSSRRRQGWGFHLPSSPSPWMGATGGGGGGEPPAATSPRPGDRDHVTCSCDPVPSMRPRLGGLGEQVEQTSHSLSARPVPTSEAAALGRTPRPSFQGTPSVHASPMAGQPGPPGR